MTPLCKKAAFPLVLVAVVFAVFGDSLANGLVWDDFLFISYGEAYRNFDLRTIFLSLGNGLEYLPVRDLSYLLDSLVWGERPFGFHLTNIAIYAATVVAVYLLAGRLTPLVSGKDEDNRVVPLMTALLFAVHPLHCEVVAWVTGRNALLSGLFFFLAAWLYLLVLDTEGKERALLYAASLVAFTLSLLAKANGIILPLILALIVLFDRRHPRRRGLLHTVPFLLLSGGVFVVFTRIATRTHIMGSDGCSSLGCLLERGSVALQIPFFYAARFLAPWTLAPDYDLHFTTGVTTRPVLGAVLVLIVAAGAAALFRRRLPSLLFSLTFYLIALIPVLNLFPTHPIVADRYAYLPSFAPCFLLAAAVSPLFGHRGLRRGWAAGAILLVVGWGGLAAAQNRIWQSEKTLWAHTVRVSPRSVLATTNLGRVFFLEKDYPRAFTLFRRAQEIDPADPHYEFFQGCFHLLNREYRPAIDAFNASLARNPEFMETLYNLGTAYEAVDEREHAMGAYRRLLQSGLPDPGNFRILARDKLLRLGGSRPAALTSSGKPWYNS